MKTILGILLFFTCTSSTCDKRMDHTMNTNNGNYSRKYTYLALGDSYTIGESVPGTDNYPNKTVSLLKDSMNLDQPLIIARTGWTTDELNTNIDNAVNNHSVNASYDFVSLLIGVNNQYRGRTVDDYKPEFEALLKRAIRFADGRVDHVIVVSIPDWGVTPFAEGRDRAQIGREIDVYNAANREITLANHVEYLDITPWTREAATDLSLVTSDGLHPSAKEYSRWALKISDFFKSKR